MRNCLTIASEGQRQTKHLLNRAFELNWGEFLEEYMASQEKTLSSAEHGEAMAAYREKREPNSSLAQVLPCMRVLGKLESIIDPKRQAVV